MILRPYQVGDKLLLCLLSVAAAFYGAQCQVALEECTPGKCAAWSVMIMAHIIVAGVTIWYNNNGTGLASYNGNGPPLVATYNTHFTLTLRSLVSHTPIKK